MLDMIKKSQRFLGTAALATAALGLMLFTVAPSAKADGRSDCYRRIQKAERDVDKAIDRHGYYSRQANHERRELQEERERCYRKGYYGYRNYRDRDYGWHRDRDRDWNQDGDWYRDPDGYWHRRRDRDDDYDD